MKKIFEQVFSTDEVIGKTIKNFIEDEQLILVFDDDTFTVFHSYDTGESVYHCMDRIDLKPSIHNCTRLFEMGIITEDEKDEIQLNHKNKYLNSTRDYELKQLAQLKAKYPGV